MDTNALSISDIELSKVFGNEVATKYTEAVEVYKLFPDLSLMRFRQIAELLCDKLAKHYDLSHCFGLSLFEVINELESFGYIDRQTSARLHKIRISANSVVHSRNSEESDSVTSDFGSLTKDAERCRTDVCTLFTYFRQQLFNHKINYKVVENQLVHIEYKEIIAKAMLSDNAKDKFLAGKAVERLFEEYLTSIPTVVCTERNSAHQKSMLRIAAELYRAAIETDAELDDVPLSYISDKNKRIDYMYSRANVEYLYHFSDVVLSDSISEDLKIEGWKALEVAAKKGHLPSKALLGALKYGEKQYEEAFELLVPAAAEDQVIALRWLYYYYSDGKACEQKLDKAIFYIEKAIELGCVSSMLEFGKALYDADVFAKDLTRSRFLLEKAQDLGSNKATLILNMFLNDGIKVMQEQFLSVLATFDNLSSDKTKVHQKVIKKKYPVNSPCHCGSEKKYKKCCRN
mgnify:CR=1 FL=1